MNPIQRRRTVRPQFALHPLGLAALVAMGGSAWALPQGATVVNGQITIGKPTAGVQVITQGTQKGIIDWKSFSIGSGEKVIFNQVSSTAITLNRVVGYDPSRILGQMTANGNVFLINPQGIVFGSGARIDVGGMVAASLSMSNGDFLGGRYDLTSAPGAKLGEVRNDGVIHAAGGGTIALVAPKVTNAGEITADGGRVGLAAVNSVSVDVEGDGMIFFRASATEAANRLDQLGRVRADGGTVELRAAARATMADTVLNMEGIVQARGLRGGDGGRVVIDGGAAGVTSVSGTVEATSQTVAAKGGEIEVLGRYVGLFGQAGLDASGPAGGGTILVGGNFQGKGPQHNAERTYVGSDVQLRADATAAGDGGRVIVWADDLTRFGGGLSARGAGAGDGGFAEVSGKATLVFAGTVDLSAPQGRIGTLLLDPLDITIASGNGTVTGFGGGDNTLVFGDGPNGGNDPVTIGLNTLNAAAATVELQARNDVILSTNVTLTTAAAGIVLRAGGDIRSSDATLRNITTNGGVVTLTANDAGGTQSGTGTISGIGAITTTASGAGTNSGIVTLSTSGTGTIDVGSIVTTGRTGANGAVGGNGGDIVIGTAGGSITTGNLTANGGTGGSGTQLGGNAGKITVTLGTTTGSPGTVTLGTLSAAGGTGSNSGNGSSGANGGAGADVTITATAGLGGAVTVGAIASTGGTGGAANNSGGTANETGGDGGAAGNIAVSASNGIGFTGTGQVNARGGNGGDGDANDTRAGGGGASGTISLVAATATSGANRTLTLPNGYLVTTVGGAIGVNEGTGGTGSLGSSTASTISLQGRQVSLGDGVSGVGVNAGAGTVAIDGRGAAIALGSGVTTTSNNVAAVVVRNASTVSLGNITTGSSGTVTLGVGTDIAGAVTQAGVITTGTLTGSTAGSVTLGGANVIDTLGAFASGAGFTLNDVGSGLTIGGNVTSSGAVAITTSGGALALGANDVSGAGVSLTGVGVSSTSGAIAGGAGTVLVDANDGAVSLGGAITTSSNSATAVVIRDGTTASLGDIGTGATGTVVLGQAAGDNLSGNITQTGVITAGTVSVVGGGVVDLGGNNAITNLGAVTRGGALTVVDTAGGLTVSGAITGGTTSNAVSITTAGGVLQVQNDITATTGAGNLTLGGVGVTQTVAGTLTVGGTTVVNAGTGTIALGSLAANFGNNFTGAVTLNATGATVSIADTNALTLAAPTLGANTGLAAIAGTTLTLPAAAISTGTGSIDLRSLGGALATTGTLSTTSGLITLVGNGLNVGHVVTTTTSAGDVTLNAGTGTLTVSQAVNGKGDLTLTADTLALTADIGNATTGRVTLQPGSTARPINFLAVASTDLSVNAVALGHLTDQGNNTGVLQIGAATSTGALTIGDAGNAAAITLGGGGLEFEGVAATRSVALNQSLTLTAATPAALLIRGPVTLGRSVTLDTSAGQGAITLDGSVAGATFDLAFNAGNGVVTSTGALSNVGTLTVTNSGGTTFQQSVGASTVTVTDTADGAVVAFLGNVNSGGTTFNLAAQPYNLTFAGATNTLAGPGGVGPFVFANTGTVTLGNAVGDAFTFTNGFTATAPSRLTIAGQVSTNNNAVSLGDVTTLTGALLNAGTGTIVINGGGGALDLGSGTFQSAASGAGGPSVDIVNATTVALANLNASAVDGAVRLGVTGNTLGSVTQNGGRTVTASALSGNVTGAVTLDGANAIGALSGFAAGAGLSVNDTTSGLTVGGIVSGGTGLTSIATAGGVLDLTGATVSGNGVTLANTHSTGITSGDVVVNAGSGTVTLTSGGAILLDGTSQINTTGTLTGSASGTVDIVGGNAIGSLGAFVSNGALTVVDSAGGLAVTGAVRTNGGGAFNGLASVTTTGNLSITTGSVAGVGVTLTATGGQLSIQNNVNGTASGTVSLGAGASGITQSAGVVTADALSVTTAGGVDLDGANQIGRLTAVAGTPTSIVINDAGGGLLVQTAVTSAGNVQLSTAGGALALGANLVSGVNVTLAGQGVTGTNVSTTNLTVTGGTGAVNLTGAVDTLLASSGTGFSLTDTGGGLTVGGNIGGGSGAVALATSGGALALGASDIGGAGVSLTGVGVTSGAASVVDAGSGTVSVNGLTGALTLAGGLTTTNATGSAVVISNASTAALGNITTGGAGTTTIGVSGAITQTGIITTGTVAGSTAGSATFDGANVLGNLGSFSANGLTVNDAGGGLNVTGTVNAGTGALSITTAGGALALGANSVSAGTTMTLGGAGVNGTGVVTAPTLAVNGGAGAVSLTNVGNTIGTLAASSGAGFTLADAGGLTVAGTVSAGAGALSITTTGAALSLGTSTLSAGTTMTLGGVGVTGTGVITAGTLNAAGGAGSVSLTNAGNAMGTLGNSSGTGITIADAGGLNVTGTVNAGTGALSLTTTGGALNIGTATLSATGSGHLLRGVGVTQSTGQVALAGAVTIDAGAGAVALASATNNFGGSVTVVSGGAVSISDTNNLTIGSLTSGANADVNLFAGQGGSGSLFLTFPPGGLDVGTGDLDLRAPGGTLQLSGTVAAGSLSITAADIQVGGNITTDLGQTYAGAVTLGANVTLTTTQNAAPIELQSGVTGGGFSLSLVTNGAADSPLLLAGGVTGVSTLSVTGRTQVDGNVTTTGSQTYSNGLTLLSGSNLDAGAGTIGITGNVVGGGFDLGLASSAASGSAISVGGTISGVGNLTVGGNIRLGGDVTTSGTQSYGDAVTLAGPATLSASSLTFSNGLAAGASDLTLSTDTLDFSGALSGSGDLAIGTRTVGRVINVAQAGTGLVIPTAVFEADGFASVTIGTSNVTGGAIGFGAVTLFAPTTVQTGGAVTFSGAVNSATGAPVALTVDAAGATTFAGSVGTTSALSGLTVTGDAAFNGTGVTTTGAQNWGGDLSIGQNATLRGTSVSIGTNVGTQVLDAGNNDLTLLANTLSIDTVAASTGRVTLAPFTSGGSIGVAGATGTLSVTQATLNKFAGTTTLQIGTGAGSGAIASNALTLPTDMVFASGTGDITFNGTVNGAHSLVVNTAGTGRFDGEVGGTVRPTSLTTNVGGTTEIAADISTVGAQIYNDDVVLVGTRSLTGSEVTFNGSIAGDSIVLKPSNGTDSIGVGVTDANKANFDFGVSQATLDKLVNFDEVVIGSTGSAGNDVTGSITVFSIALPTSVRMVSDTGTVDIIGALNAAVGRTAALTIDTAGLTTISAGIGQSVALAGLNVVGTSQVNATAITTSGIQTWGGAMTVGSPLTLTGSGVEFGGDVAIGANAVRVFANSIAVAPGRDFSGTGAVTLAPIAAGDSIGLAGAVGDLQISQDLIDAFGGVGRLLIGRTTGTGTITAGDLSLPTDVRLQSLSGNVALSGNVNAAGGQHDLVVDTGGTVRLAGNFGGAGALGLLSINGATLLTGATTIAADTVSFGGTVDGARALTITGVDVGFDAAVGGTTALTSLFVTASGATTLGGDLTTTGSQRYSGNVSLASDVTASGSTLRFDDSIDGARALVLQGTGGVRLDGVVGGTTALTSLTVAGATDLRSSEIVTSGAQSYGGTVTLGTAATRLQASRLTFTGDVTGAAALTVQSAGLTRFDGDVGGATALTSLTLQGGGAAQVGGDTVRTTGAQAWSGAVTLSGATTFTANALNFAGAVSGATDLTLLTNTLTGAASLSGTGTLSIAANDLARSIDLAPTAANGSRLQIAQSVLNGAGGFTRHVIGRANGAGNITAGALDLRADTVLRTNTGNISLTGRVDGAFDLQVNSGGETLIAGPIGGQRALTSLTTDNNAAAADWNGTTGERTLFARPDGSAGDQTTAVTTTGAQTYNDPVVSRVPVQLNGGAIIAIQTGNPSGQGGNQFGRAVNVDAQTLTLASDQSITLGNVTLSNGGTVETAGTLELAGNVTLSGGTLVLLSTATPSSLTEFTDPELIGKGFGLTGLGEASATINQTGGTVSSAAGTVLVLRAAGNGSISLQSAGNDLRGEISAVAGPSGKPAGEPSETQPLSFVRIFSTDIRVAGAPVDGGTGDRLGIEGDVVKLTADRLATGAEGEIRARLPFRPLFGASKQIPALTLVMSLDALTNGGQFGAGNDPAGWIRVSIGDSEGAFLTVRPKGAGSDTAFILLAGDPLVQPFYDGAGKVTEVRVFYNGDTPRTAQESGALAAVQAVAEDARQTRFEEAVRTENVRARLRSGVIAEVGAGRPATVGRESIQLPQNCDPKAKSLECQ